MEKFWRLYSNLPAESLNLMLKNMEVMNNISRSWRNFCSGGEKVLWPEQMGEVFGETFKMLYRPLELITGKKIAGGGSAEPRDFFDAYFKLITNFPTTDSRDYFQKSLENYARYFSAWYELGLKINFYDAWRSFFEELVHKNDPDNTEKVAKTGLFAEWQNIWGDIYKSWFDFAQKYGFPFKTEDIFMLPKEAVEAFYKSGECYLDLQKSWMDYSSRLFSGWQQATQKFIQVIHSKINFSGPALFSMTFKEYFEVWMSSLTSVFDEMVTSKDYVEAQSKMIGHLSDFIRYQKDSCEAFLSVNPVLPFVYRTEGDIFSQRYFSLSRKVRELEKKSEEFMSSLEELKDMLKMNGTGKKGEEAEEGPPGQ